MAILAAVVMAALVAAEARTAEATLGIDSLASEAEQAVAGTVTARCDPRGSTIELDLGGLRPRGRYSVWLFLFDRAQGMLEAADAVGAGALGGRTARHEFTADPSGRARVVVPHPAGPLSAFGAVPGCLLDQPQWRLVGGLHPRGVRAGIHMPPPGEIVEQFGATYRRP